MVHTHLIEPGFAVAPPRGWVAARRDYYWLTHRVRWDDAVQLAREDWIRHEERDGMSEFTNVAWSDEDVDDHVLGSGAIGDGCVRDARADGNGYLLFMDDPQDHDGNCRWYRLTRDDFRRVAGELIDGKHVVNPQIRADITTNEIDADAACVIIQIAVYGEIPYSF